MSHAVERTPRGKTVVDALRLIAHTGTVDPAFFAECVQAAGADVTPGFGSILEQDVREFSALLEHVKGCRSVLEIGSRYGESIKHFAAVIEPRSRVVAVDLPYAAGEI